jgi:pimeloyl-ACP methyl ester carboxylesterase
MVSLLRDPIFRGTGVEAGDGQPVLLVPGFLAGDDSLALMVAWLERTGHRVLSAGIRFNANCAGADADRLTVLLEEQATAEGRPVIIIGQSRGGLYARILGSRRPDLVSGIVTLGAAHLDPLAVHPLVSLQIRALALLGSLGAPGLFTNSCFKGECCARVRDDLAEPFPREVGFVSVFSRGDGIVDWRACLDPAASCVEIDSSHCGMGAHPDAYRVIARALSDFRRSMPAAEDTPTAGRA